VFWGESSSASAANLTAIAAFSRCDLQQNGNVTVVDVQLIVNEALAAATPVYDLSGDGVVTVVDVQIEINAALGLVCSAN